MKADQDYKNALKAATDSAAKVAQLDAVGGITAHNSPDIAKTIAEMQRKYIENLNFDALEVACISALDCLSSVLPMIQAKKGQLLNAIIARAENLRDTAENRAELKKSMTEIEDYVTAAKKYIEQVKALKAIKIDDLRVREWVILGHFRGPGACK